MTLSNIKEFFNCTIMTLSYAVYEIVVLLTVDLLTSVSCQVTELNVYKANSQSDMKKLAEWFSVTNRAKSLMENDETAIKGLEKESCQKKKSDVCRAFHNAKNRLDHWKKICPKSGLWISECYALSMYTDAAYRKFNEAAMKGDFETYKVFSYLLNCAVRRLSLNKNFKVEDNEKLYRCLKTKHTRPNAEKIYWKTFTSTSLDKEGTCSFGSATKIEFEPEATKFGAKIMNFSKFSDQTEVLIPPFESYDVLKSESKNPEIIRFKSSLRQKHDLSGICRK